MGFWELVLALMVAKSLPSIIVGTGVVAVGGTLALKRSFENAAKNISTSVGNAIEAHDEARERAEVAAHLQDAAFPAQLPQMTQIRQSGFVSTALAMANEGMPRLDSAQTGNLAACLQSYKPDTGFLADTHHIKPMLRFISKNRDAIGAEAVSALTDKAFTIMAASNADDVSEESLDDACYIAGAYGDMMKPGHKALCRAKIIAALQSPQKAFGVRREPFSLERGGAAVKALEILFVPRYSHGGEKGTAALSLEKGGYTAEERAAILEKAAQYKGAIQAAVDKSKDPFAYMKPGTAERAAECLRGLEKYLGSESDATAKTVPAAAPRLGFY